MTEISKKGPNTRIARILDHLTSDQKLHVEPIKLITHPIFSPHYGPDKSVFDNNSGT